MISEKEKFKEWLNRAAEEIIKLRKRPRLAKEKKIQLIRENYNVISVLKKVASREAYMVGTPPLVNTTEK